MTREEDRAPVSTGVKRQEGETYRPMLHLRLFGQLKQRNVFRVAILYLVVCWLILEPVHVIFHMLDVPIWANRVVVMLMAMGFPAVVIFAWVYEITPEGLKPTVEVPHGQSIRKLTGRRLDAAIIAVLILALAYFVVDKFWISKYVATSRPAAAAAQGTAHPADVAPTAFSPPPQSIAVLPFVNMSGDKEQEYFSDGLSEELLNSLSRINELQVAARTSSFYFKGKDVDLGMIARKLNVAAVLEGSVRRSKHKVRITTQLINAVTGYHLWSATYDRDLGDVLSLQTEIATTVASALEVKLLGDEAAKVELGGTRSPGALDAYLRGSKAYNDAQGASGYLSSIAAYTEAIRLDPNYALAFAGRSRANSWYAGWGATGAAIREYFEKAQADARQALKIAPELADGHLALAFFLSIGALDFFHASQEYERTMALARGSAAALAEGGWFTVVMGRFDVGLAAERRAVALDPLNPAIRERLAEGLLFARRYGEAVGALDGVISLEPDHELAYAYRCLAYYELGDLENAAASYKNKAHFAYSQWCLALAYYKLGRHADAEAGLAQLKATIGDAAAYQYAEIYAQWGDHTKGLEWLDTAMRLHDPGLAWLKIDPLLDPLRNEPRFHAIEKALNFPP